jgi:malonate-semialdehyde dehydrogenase (acetylating)/methylmalonate-semialdehyde dehydrogenase
MSGRRSTPPAARFRRGGACPCTDRVQFLFKLKEQLERHFDEISRTITLECGKTLAESRGEMRRAVENVDVACGTPILIQGYNSEDIAAGIDEIMIASRSACAR